MDIWEKYKAESYQTRCIIGILVLSAKLCKADGHFSQHEKDEILKILPHEKNKNAVQNYYLFNEETVKINNKNLRIMTRYKFKDLNATKPMYVDCYIDFVKLANQKLVDFNLGTSESNFTVSNEYLESGYNKKQFLDIKQKNCRYLN